MVGERHPRAGLGHHGAPEPSAYTGSESGHYRHSLAPQVLFGNDYINNKSESGGRIQAGMWLNPCATFGFEGEFFALADENTNYYHLVRRQPDHFPAVLSTSTRRTRPAERRVSRLSPRQPE